MAVQVKEKISVFDSQQLEAISRILGQTDTGLTGPEIERMLQECRVSDVDPSNTKWKRLFNALGEFQNKHQVGNHVLVFINLALNPAKHIQNPERFEQWRTELNKVLSLTGMQVTSAGKVGRAQKAQTLSEAIQRANRFKAKLEQRNVHSDVLRFCASEIATDNYFHAVFEAMKSISNKVRTLSGLDGDGADLYDAAFGLGKLNTPVLAINSLTSETLRGEQKGFLNLLKGLFGTIRNPLGHESKIEWEMKEDDALDIMTAASLVHRKLDKATRPRIDK